MLAEFVAEYFSAIVAAFVLLPVLVFSLAMFVEGAGRHRWTTSLRAGTCREASARTRPAARAERTTGGLGLRHGVAAPHDHE